MQRHRIAMLEPNSSLAKFFTAASTLSEGPAGIENLSLYASFGDGRLDRDSRSALRRCSSSSRSQSSSSSFSTPSPTSLTVVGLDFHFSPGDR
jgi:hypothetical protein